MTTTQQAMPILRFPEFSGEWKYTTLGEIAKFRRGSFPQPYGLPEWYDDNNGYPFVQVFDVDKNFRLKPTTKQKISELATKKSVFVPKKSIVLTIQGSIGRIAITQYDAYVDRTLLIFTGFNQPVDEYFFSQVIFLLFEKEKRIAPGGTIKTITKEVLSAFKFYNPFLPEQQKIASFLSAVDTKIEHLGKKITLLEQYKKGMMQKLFSQEIRFKDMRGNDYPDWEEKHFGQFVKKITDSYNPATSDDNWESIELESLGQGNGKILKTFKAKNLQSIKTKFLAGDVLFGKLRPYLRKYAYVEFNGVCTSEIWVLRAKEVLDKFLYFVIQSSRFNQFANIQSGSKMPRSDWKIVSSTRFSIASLPEQQKIADFLSAIDQKIELLSTELELAQTFKKGLLQQMFI